MGFRIVPVSATTIESGDMSGAYTLSGTMASPNYAPGAAGWVIKGDGSAEFNNITARGELDVGTATRYIKALNRPLPDNAPGILINPDASQWPTDGVIEASVFGTPTTPGLVLRSPYHDNGTALPAEIDIVSSDETGTVAPTVNVLTSMSVAGDTTIGGISGVKANLTVSGNLSAGNIQAGSVNIFPTANTPTSAAVTFPALQGSKFYGFVSAATTVPGTAVTGVGITGVTATGATIWVTRTNTTQTTVNYLVFGV